jgi:hypothetical protein
MAAVACLGQHRVNTDYGNQLNHDESQCAILNGQLSVLIDVFETQ